MLFPFFLVRISLVFHKTFKINFKLLTFCVVSPFAKQNNTKQSPYCRQMMISYWPAPACDIIAHLSDTCCDHLTTLRLTCAAATLLLPIAIAKCSRIIQINRKKSMKTIQCFSTIWCSARGQKDTSLQGDPSAANLIKGGLQKACSCRSHDENLHVHRTNLLWNVPSTLNYFYEGVLGEESCCGVRFYCVKDVYQ